MLSESWNTELGKIFSMRELFKFIMLCYRKNVSENGHCSRKAVAIFAPCYIETMFLKCRVIKGSTVFCLELYSIQ